jgi:hypothetical protein
MADTVDASKCAPIEPMVRIELSETQKQKPIWELADEILGQVPLEERNRVPYDAAEHGRNDGTDHSSDSRRRSAARDGGKTGRARPG